jgi:large subunit ribosomal protein L19
MSQQILDLIEERYIKDVPKFSVGDTVRVFFRIREGEKERVQPFEGTVIKIQGARHRKTFTVRRISGAVAVERTFPLYSPRLEKVNVLRYGKVRRAKLYYLRERRGKAARVKERYLSPEERAMLKKGKVQKEVVTEPATTEAPAAEAQAETQVQE